MKINKESLSKELQEQMTQLPEDDKNFLTALEELCVKYNKSLYAGRFGVKVVSFDDKGNHIETALEHVNLNQNTATKEFILE